MPSAVTLQHPNGAQVEVRPSDVADCLARGFSRVRSNIPDINHGFAASRIGRHIGRIALIVGNGPSLRNVSPNAIQALVERHNMLVVGCNNMFDPWGTGVALPCDYWVILDKKFWNINRDEILGVNTIWKSPSVLVFHFDPQVLMIYERIVVDTANDPIKHCRYQPDIYPHGHSSGVAAINHALHMGCKRLYLLGHDLTLDCEGNTHGFGIRDSERRGYYQGDEMLPGYEVAAMWAGQLDCEIFNLSPISRIPSFPFMDVVQLMKG